MIFYFNLDVSGGIEYTGNEIEKWLKEKYNESVYVSKKQQHHFWNSRDLNSFKPKTIILNELFENVIISSYHYKVCFPNTKIVVFIHDWKQIEAAFTINSTQAFLWKEFFKICDNLIVLNYCPDKSNINKCLPNKVIFMSFPVDPELYKITVSWKEREKKFVYLGTIMPLKFSEAFIRKLYKESIKIDVYGYKHTVTDEFKEYNKLFDECPNIVYKGNVKQEDVAGVLNQYKYYILPHTGKELFNISLKHAICCGAVPIILKENDVYDWLGWAEGLYFSSDTLDSFINNIKQLLLEDVEDVSQYISDTVHSRFNYYDMKEKVLNILCGAIC